MAEVIDFELRRRAKPKTEGLASSPSLLSKREITKNRSDGIAPRVLQLTTADGWMSSKAPALVGPPSALMTPSIDLIMADCTSRTVNTSSLHMTAVEGFLNVAFNKRMAETLKSLAARIKMSREALGLSAAELCRQIDCKPNRWSQYEAGDRKITLEVANALCDEFGLSLDWIYRGNPAQLPHALRLKMRQVA